MANNMTFKQYLTEVTMDVDLNDPAAATQKIKQAARMGAGKTATMGVRQAQKDMRDARDAEPGDPTKQMDMKIATLTSQLAQLQQRKARMMKTQGSEQGGAA